MAVIERHPDRIRHIQYKDALAVDALGEALADTGVALTCVLAEPRTNFTLPGTDLTAFFEGLDRGVEAARRLGCPRIVVGSGIGFPGAKRARNLDILVDAFTEAVDRTVGSGVKLVLEQPLGCRDPAAGPRRPRHLPPRPHGELGGGHRAEDGARGGAGGTSFLVGHRPIDTATAAETPAAGQVPCRTSAARRPASRTASRDARVAGGHEER